jgi:carboxymethylenebutenolidase
VVIQEAFGVNDHIRATTDTWAQQGFHAVAPELFHRDGSPEIPYDRFDLVREPMTNLNRENITDDLHAALEYLAGLGFAREGIGIVGYCMGGTVALAAASLDLVGCAVTFYGGGVTTGRFGFPALVDLAPSLSSPWLGLYGDLDQSIPVDQVEQLAEAASSAPVETEVVRYPQAGHGFNCDQRPANYDATAAADATARALDFLTRNLRAR